MKLLECNECRYENNCPVMWSYCNAACLKIQKEKENKMDNSIYEVEREDYKTFIEQLDLYKMDKEEDWLENLHITKLISQKTGKHLCSRVGDLEKEEEHYYIFNYPDKDEQVEPKGKLHLRLETREEVQAFFNILSKLQKEGKI